MAEAYTVLRDFELEEIGNNEWRLKTFIGFDVPECIEIPAEIDGKKIVEIGKKLFFGNKDLKQVKIAEGIRVICESAFADCEQLKGVVFSETLLSIAKKAFCRCGRLERIVFPKSIQSIGQDAFQIFNITKDSQFFFAEDCNITLKNDISDGGIFYIPASVTVEKLVSNGEGVSTIYCSTIYCHAGSSAMAYARKHGIKCADYDKAMQEIRQKEEKELVEKKKREEQKAKAKAQRSIPLSERDFICSGDFPPDQEHIVIPAHIKTIRRNAFHSRECLKSITFEDGSMLEVIEAGAFAERLMEMEEIRIPKSVRKIGKDAFHANLDKRGTYVRISFEEGSLLEEIGESAFERLSAPNISTQMYNGPFYELKLPEHIHTIGERAFAENCGIIKVDMNMLAGLRTISKAAFESCKNLKQVAPPPNLEAIEGDAFAFSKIESITLPSSCQRIEGYAFTSSLKKLVVPETCEVKLGVLPNAKIIRQNVAIKPKEERAPKGGFMSKFKNFFGQLKD